jgi:prolyl oligopeptidase
MAAALAFALAFLAAGAPAAAGKPAYPPTKVQPVTDTYFGVQVTDPYRWLERGEDPEVQAWTDQQNAFARKVIDSVSSRPAIIRQLTELWDYPKMGTPAKSGPYYFFTKNDGLQNQSPLYVQEGLQGSPRVLIDPNDLASDGTVAMDWYDPSEHGKYVAYGTSSGGTEQSVLRVKETATGKDLADAIEGCRFSSVAWLKDDSGFYYTRFPKPGSVSDNEVNYNQKVFLHKLGRDPETDALVFGIPAKKEVTFSLELSKDGRHLLVFAGEGSDARCEVYSLDTHTGAFQQVVRGFEETYSGEVLDGIFYCLTSQGAPSGCVVAVDLKNPQRDQWRILIPEGKDLVEELSIVNRKLVLRVLHNATSQVKVYALDGTFEKEIPLPPMGSVTSMTGRWNSGEVFLQFSSFTRPPGIYRYEMGEPELDEFFTPTVPFNGDEYETEQVWYTSRDGTKVSMFLVHRKGMKKDGKPPCYLTGYGGFAIAETPRFSPSVAWWLRQGGVFALPNLRGGNEYGEAWHRAGMLQNKQNVFDDFIAAAEWLIQNKVTSVEKLAIEGGSNGGLLTGACLVQRPDLFGAVVVEVPLLDMLRYHLFSIARYWIPEYGSSETKGQFEVLLKYSPYQNVKDSVAYPATLLMAGANDSRVDPLHAQKMAALLQAKSTGKEPILLRVETKAGHGQGKPTSKRIEEAADRYAFLVKFLGMKVSDK